MNSKRKVFITGATRGIGRAILDAIAGDALTVTALARQPESLDKLKADITRKHQELSIDSIAVDASDFDQLGRALRDWRSSDRAVDTVILDAGSYTEGELSTMPMEDYIHDMNLNLNSNVLIMQHLVPILESSDSGNSKRVIIIGSTAAHEPYPLVPTYGVAKWGLRGYALNLREELHPKGIGVTFLSPGGTLTDMWEGEELPPDRLLRPADIAAICRLILTELSHQAVVEELIVRPIEGDIHE